MKETAIKMTTLPFTSKFDINLNKHDKTVPLR